MKTKLTRLYFKLYIRFLAFRWIFQTNIGDMVWHKGRIRMVTNGVVPTCWTLDDPREEMIPRSECRKAWTLRNITHSYSFGVSFYEQNWLEIWVRNGIEPWMRGLNIWPR